MVSAWCALITGLLVAVGCGGGGDSSPPPPPTALDQGYSVLTNVQISDILDAIDVDWSTDVFYVDVWPAFGTLSVDQVTGDFTYTPDINFVGTDNFTWYCVDQFGDSNIAEVTIVLSAVADNHAISPAPNTLLLSIREGTRAMGNRSP